MKRLAIVVQRYAEEITGGAERHARLVAELLAPHYQVEVLTSCALDYTKWAMHFPPGSDKVAGISLLRFAHPVRNDIGRARVPLVHKLRFKLRSLLSLLSRSPLVLAPCNQPVFDGLDFLRRQGPHCASLFDHLDRSHERYDAVIFFTALYEPSAVGIQRWGKRSILVPLLHDEKPMYQPVFRRVFASAGATLFNTASERRLASRMYGLDTSREPLAGIGVEMPLPQPEAVAAVLARFGLLPGYIVYVGRVDVSKGCRELIDAFLALAKTEPSVRLVLVGQAVMAVPDHPRITQTGFVTESERDALVAAAAALVIPSRYESLSAVLLEAMLLKTPVIANGACEVLAEHVRNSGCGVTYHGPRQLRAAILAMMALDPAERQRMGELGATYVKSNYTWERVLEVFKAAIERVCGLPAGPVARPSTT